MGNVAKKVYRLIPGLEPVHQVVRANGGITGACKKVLTVYQERGIKSLLFTVVKVVNGFRAVQDKAGWAVIDAKETDRLLWRSVKTNQAGIKHIRLFIDRITWADEKNIRITGWAFREGACAGRHSPTGLIFSSAKSSIVDVQWHKRDDVRLAHPHTRIPSEVGFDVMLEPKGRIVYLMVASPHYERLAIRVVLPDARHYAKALKLPSIAIYDQVQQLNQPSLKKIVACADQLGVAPVRAAATDETVRFNRLLSTVKVVSFDVFDTLVERVVPNPVDVFARLALETPELGEQRARFVDLRVRAEQKARAASPHEEITLAEIYHQLQQDTGFATALCEQLQAAEIRMEKLLLRQKAEGAAYYQAALEAGCRVIVVSDIYLAQETIQEILEQCGYSQWAELFVSSVKRKTKHTGRLFAEVVESCAPLKAEDILHVGDNQHSDIAMARQAGLHTFLVAKSTDQWAQIAPGHWHKYDQMSCIEQMMTGLIIHERAKTAQHSYSNPQATWLGNPRLLGYATLGPVLLGFVVWLVQRIQADSKIKNCAFLSRDAYFFKQAYDRVAVYVKDLPPALYIPASRQLCMAADIVSWADILRASAVDHHPMSMADFLKARFGYQSSDLMAISTEQLTKAGLQGLNQQVSQNSPAKLALLKLLQTQILQIAHDRADNYRAYLQSLAIDFNETALVDIGYSGTAQLAIANITGAQPSGLYLLTSERASKLKKAGLSYDGWIANNAKLTHPFFTHVQLWELMLSATHGSVTAVDKQHDWIMDDSNMSSTNVQMMLALVRQGAIEFVEHMLDLHGKYIFSSKLTPEMCTAGLNAYFADPHAADIALLLGLRFEDAFGGDNRPLLITPLNSQHEVCNQSAWPEGSKVLAGGPTVTPYHGQNSISVLPDDVACGPASPACFQAGFKSALDVHGWPVRGIQWPQSVTFVVPVQHSTREALVPLLKSLSSQFGPGVSVVLAVWPRVVMPELPCVPASIIHVANNQEFMAYLSQQVTTDWLWLCEGNEVFDSLALYEVHCALQKNPQCSLLTFDHDLFSAEGQRMQPHFTPELSPELLLTTPYIGTSYVVSMEALKGLSQAEQNISGADWPLHVWLWSLAWRISGTNAHRIPRVLSSAPARQYSSEEWAAAASAACEWVQTAFSVLGQPCQVVIPEWAQAEQKLVCAPVFPDEGPEVAIVVPTRNQHKVVKTCVESLKKTTYKNFTVYLVDNNSDDPESVKYFKTLAQSGIQVLHIPSPPEGFSYSYVNNRAVEMTKGEPFLLFLNNDTEVIEPQWLSQMVGWGRLPGVGSVGALLYYPHEKVQHAGITHKLLWGMLPAPSFKLVDRGERGYQDYIRLARDSAAQTAACLLTPRSVFNDFGAFDDVNFKVAYNDCDYGFKLAQAGLRNVYCPDAELYHYEGLTRGRGRGNDKPAEEAAFVRKYAEWADPFYNPNLTVNDTDFSLRACVPATVKTDAMTMYVATHNLNFEGAPLVLFELVKRLVEDKKIRVKVLSLEDGLLKKQYEAIGCQVDIAPHAHYLFSAAPEDAQQAIRTIAGMLAGADVVLANTVLSWWAVEAARLVKLPALWVIHESEPPFTHLRPHNLDIARAELALAYAYKVVFVSWATRDVFASLESRYNFHVFHNGFDSDAYKDKVASVDRAAVRAQLNKDENCLIGLLPGTVCERKGQLDLIEAIRLMPDDNIKQVHFLIVGDRKSDYSDMLHAALAALPEAKRNAVSVLPHCADIEKYFVAADFMVMTSRIEAFPKVIQEAMYYALPMVVTPVFGIIEQVQDDVSALFYPVGDAQKLSDQLCRLFGSAPLRQKLAGNAAVSLGRLPSMTDMVEEYWLLIQEASLSCSVDPLL